MKIVKANIRFKDKQEENVWRTVGEKWQTTDERAWELTQTYYNSAISYCSYDELPWDDSKGERILLFNYDLYKIGGTETFLLNFCKYFQNKNIVLLYKSGKKDYLELLNKYVNVCQDNGNQNYECDVLIMGNYFSSKISPRVKAKTKYQMIHADYRGMREAGWKLQMNKPADVNLICVSDSASDGLKAEFGYESITQYNILDFELTDEKPIIFVTLSRATKEKGIHRIVELCKLFKKYNKKFLWMLCGSVIEQSENALKKEIAEIEELVLIPPSHSNKALISAADYLVQLSDTESFCYSAYESLQMNTPVIITDFPESINIVEDGENGYIISRNEALYNEELVEKIFNKIPTNIHYTDRCDYELWERILRGDNI